VVLILFYFFYKFNLIKIRQGTNHFPPNKKKEGGGGDNILSQITIGIPIQAHAI
jgi:hypothetical protein